MVRGRKGWIMELNASHSELPKDVEIGRTVEREAQRKRSYSRLYRRFILINLVCSLVPLLLVGWGINRYYSKFAASRMTASFESQVDHHRRIIDLFLRERSSRLRLLAQTHSKSYLGQASNLMHVFEILNQEYGSMEDLGVINSQGRHAARPFHLLQHHAKAGGEHLGKKPHRGRDGVHPDASLPPCRGWRDQCSRREKP
jgi:hypothetical protein